MTTIETRPQNTNNWPVSTEDFRPQAPLPERDINPTTLEAGDKFRDLRRAMFVLGRKR